jgi:hypothetical protein
MAAWMDAQFLGGEQADLGSKMLAAVRFFSPRFGKGGDLKLPLASQALKGWRKKAPSKSRMPLPIEAVFLIALALVDAGRWSMAVCVLLLMNTYMRPSEAMSLTTKDLIPPIAGSRHSHFSLVLHPFESGVSSKTQQYDEAVIVNGRDFDLLTPALAKLALMRQGQLMLFPFSQKELAVEFVQAAAAAGLSFLCPVLYMLRHSGPSHDRSCEQRTLAEVKLRGRWMSDLSVRRYEKEGRVQQQLQRMPPAVRRAAFSAMITLAHRLT